MKRYKHNLSNYHLTTLNMGELVPVQLQEILPGDSMRIASSALIRMSPMLAPVMHPITVRLHHFFVPSRVLWDGWEDFITGGPDNADTSTIPTVAVPVDAGKVARLGSYLGLPVEASGSITANALPFRAYNMIWNEYYRDQDLQNEVSLDSTAIQRVNWRKDYFTAARPWTQKGMDLTLPIGTTAPVWGRPHPDADKGVLRKRSDGTQVGSNIDLGLSADGIFSQGVGTGSLRFVRDGDPGTGSGLGQLPSPLIADLSEATGVTAKDFREFFALQRYAEARARFGSRYVEYLRYLGITPSDARLQRPEYLGGGKSTLQISEVLSTNDTFSEDDVAAGKLRGHGISALRTRGTRRFFEEHGYMMTLMSVVPKSIYADGAQRLFLKRHKEDFYQRELQNVGQQAVYQGEIYAKNNLDNFEVFGYQDRYSEYGSSPSRVSGQFYDTLDFWHLGRKFSAAPNLNSTFTTCSPSDRIFADQTAGSHHLWCMINNRVVARRMPKTVSVGALM